MSKYHSARVRRLTHPAWLGTLRRTRPLSDVWGFDRGTPVDRFYIEQFLQANRRDIRGHVLEIKDSAYTDLYGEGVVQRDVLDIDATNPQATIIADLAAADQVAASSFDCVILTQTLHLIYEVQAAIRHVHRCLRPGGVLLATLPTVSRVSRGVGVDGDYWRFTVASCSRIFGDIFGMEQIGVHAHGNVLSAIAFLSGMAYEELAQQELKDHDPYFPVVISVRAVKA